jgi:hypothetical protein
MRGASSGTELARFSHTRLWRKAKLVRVGARETTDPTFTGSSGRPHSAREWPDGKVVSLTNKAIRLGSRTLDERLIP